MRAVNDDAEYAVPDRENRLKGALALEFRRNPIAAAAGSAHAVHHLECPTLIEHVVDFLDRYNWAAFGLR
jgi:hypothetical protein